MENKIEFRVEAKEVMIVEVDASKIEGMSKEEAYSYVLELESSGYAYLADREITSVSVEE